MLLSELFAVKLEAKVEMCSEACCGVPVTECSCGPDCKHCDCYEKNKGVEESATAGATAAGNIASVEAPHLSPGKARGKKSYTGDPWGGKSGTKAPPQPKVKQPKAANGTAKNGLDMKGNIFGGGAAIKR